jgi:thiamine-phosphate pyrophosphorylase
LSFGVHSHLKTLVVILMPTITNIARRLNLAADTLHLPPLVLITDEIRLPDPKNFISLLPPGSAVLLRHYDIPNRKELAKSLRKICDAQDLALIVANDVNLALEVKADGLHLPNYRLNVPPKDFLKWGRSGNGFLTAAIHSSQALIKALRLKVDAAFLSPVFRTESHPKKAPLGLMRFIKICNSTDLPIYALGGIDNISAKRMLSSGATGIAGLGGIVETTQKAR